MKKRKSMILINRDFQLRYTMAAVIVGLISTLVTVAVVIYPLFVFELLRVPRFLPTPIFAAMLAAVCLNIFLVGLMGIYITHRIAGPMYSLVRCFRRLEVGRWAGGRLQVRKNDDLKYLVRNYNNMVDGLLAQNKIELEMVEGICDATSDEERALLLTEFRNLISGRVTI